MNTKPAAHAGNVAFRPYPVAQVLAETREELALLTAPATRDATARAFGLAPEHVTPYIDTLHAQERNLAARLARESAKV